MVVVIDVNLGIQTVLLQGLVILGGEFHVGDDRSLKVDGQGELEDVVQVGVLAAVAVVHLAFQSDGVGGVVGEIVFGSIEFDLDVGGVDGTAVAVGLTDIVIHGLEDHFTGGVIGDGDVDILCGSEHTGPDETQCVDGAILVGQGDVVLVGGDGHVGRILQEVVGTQVADIVALHAADGTGCVGVSLGLVFLVDALVQLVAMGIEVLQVEHGRTGPVAVECQVGNAQVDLGALGGSQGQVAFHVHAVGKGLIQVCLVGIAQGDANLHIGSGLRVHGDLVVLGFLAVDGDNLHNCAVQNVSLFGDGGLTGIGLGFADTFSHDIGAQVIGQVLVADVVDGEGHLIDAGLLDVVTQLQLGLVHLLAVGIEGGDVSGSLGGIDQVSQASALLSDCVGLTVGIQSDIGGRHQKLVDHGGNFHIVIGNVGEVLNNILTQQDDDTCQVGASHGSTGQTVIAATGDGGQNVTAVAGDFGLDLQVGSGAPGREVGNEGTGGLLLADLQLAAASGDQHLTVVLRDGADGQLGIAYVHLDLTGYIIIYNDTGCTLGFCDHGLLFEGVVTTADQCDLAGNIHAAVVSATADAGDDHVFQFDGFLIAQQSLTEVVLFSGGVVGLVEVDDGITIQQVGSLGTADGSDGQNAVVSGGRTDGSGIGVGSQTQVTVCLGTVSGGVAVGSSSHDADAGSADLVVDAVQQFLFRLGAEAAGSTQRHVDDIDTQDDTVFQRGQNPGAHCGVFHVGEDLHGNQLCVGRNAGDDIVLTDDNTGDVGTVVVVGGVDVGIVVGIVIAKGDLFVDVHIVNAQAAVLLAGNGLANHSGNVRIGHAQLLGSKILNREGGVIGIQAGIQNCDSHAAAVVGNAGAVENTGLGEDVDGVLNQFGFSLLVDLTDDGTLTLAQGLAGSGVIGSLDDQLEAGQHGGIILAGAVGNALLVQSSQDRRLALSNLLLDGSSFVAVQRIVREAHGLVCCFVSRHHIDDVGGDDHGNLLIIADGFRQPEHHGLVNVVHEIRLQILPELNTGALIGRRLNSGDGDRADENHCRHEQEQHHLRNLYNTFILHLFSPFAVYFCI